jgi:Zn-dependent protease with chaperone function
MQSPVESRNAGNTETPSAFITVELNRDSPTVVSFNFETALKPRHNFAQILSAALGCELQNQHVSLTDHGMSELAARCDLPLRRTLLTHAGEINVHAFKDLLHSESDFVIGVSVVMPSSDVVRCDPAPAHTIEGADRAIFVYVLNESVQIPDRIQFELGYGRAHAVRMGFVLGILLVVPIALMFWFRRRALSVPELSRPTLSFAHRRFIMWMSTLGALAWWAAIDLLHADEYMMFLLPSTKWTDLFSGDVFVWVLLWIPPVAVYFLCLLLSSPLQVLRGTDHSQREIFGRSFWAVARFALPFSFFALSLASMENSPRTSVVLFAAGIFLGGLTRRQFARAYGMDLHALTSGELRDRAFSMAQAAKTKLNQLYVLPMERMRIANAFAHSANNIFLTDYLVKNMSKREVDAILAHELAHLQSKHIARRMTIMFVAVIGMGFGLAYSEYWLPHGFPFGPLFLGLLFLLLFFTSRRNEFAADAGAVKLTGDAEALITSLAKLSQLNTMPIHWGKTDEKLLSHPSTLRRIKQLAIAGGIPETRIPELLNQSVSQPADVYSIPSTALPLGKVFSTRYKTRNAWKYAWSAALTTALIPSLVAYGAQMGQSGYLFVWTTYLVGFVLTIAAETLVANYFGRRGLPKLEAPLREKAKAEGAAWANRGGVFMSFTPDSAPRIYEGNWAWDLGFLSITPKELVYWGEEARFVLRRREVVSVWIGSGSFSWFDDSAVHVRWRDSAGQESTFITRPLSTLSTSLLAQDLESWHIGTSVRSDSPLVADQISVDSLSVPKFGQVTSMSPRNMVGAHHLVRDLVFNTFVALGMVFALGLFLPPLDMLAEPSGSAYVNPVAGAVYVLVVVLLTRLFLLIPFWRARETTSSGTIAPTSVASKNQ